MNSVSFFKSSNFSMPWSGCAISTCGSFWNMAATASGRDVLLDRIEALQRVGAHEEVELADRQQDAVVHVRPARHDGDVEPVFAIGAVDQRLIEAAVLGLRHPVGAERDLVEGLLRGGGASEVAAATTGRHASTVQQSCRLSGTARRRLRRACPDTGLSLARASPRSAVPGATMQKRRAGSATAVIGRALVRSPNAD